MKRILWIFLCALVFTFDGHAQEAETSENSVEIAKEQQMASESELKEAKRKQKETKKNEKELKKAERARKKAEKEAKKSQKLIKSIASKRKSIEKREAKIVKYQNKLTKGKSKGKLSPVDEMELNNKINKLKLDIVKDREKLAKLERKQ